MYFQNYRAANNIRESKTESINLAGSPGIGTDRNLVMEQRLDEK